jgi:hypothetical protein
LTKTQNQKYTKNATTTIERDITIVLGYATKVFDESLDQQHIENITTVEKGSLQ